MKHVRPLIVTLFLLLFTFSPLILPVAASGDSERPVIIIDPGHGGADGGTTAGYRYEKTYNLIIAQHLRDLLLDHGGFEVYMTREEDIYLKFLPRALNIVEHNADLLLSLHCNSSTVDYANGALVITSRLDDYAAFALGEDILTRISEATGLRNKGVETHKDTGDSLGVYYWDSEKNWDMPGASYLKTISDYFSMTTWSSKFGIPSLIIEHGYLSNPGDRDIIDKNENLLKLAEAEAAALIDYYYGHTHTYTAEKVVDFPSNCSMNGTMSYHCTVCGIKKDTEPLPAAPDAHFYRQSASMLATCGTDGFIEYVCQISFNLNDKGYTTPVHTQREILPKKEHRYQTAYEIPPSCTETGRADYCCDNCGDTYSETTPATGHSLNEGGGCVVCGMGLETTALETETETATPASPDDCLHAFEVHSRTAATCEEAGVISSVCTLCGEEKTETTAAVGHDLIVSTDTPAECTKDGYYRARCHRCGEETMETRTALGHDYVPADDERGGEIPMECSRCGDRTTHTVERRSIADLLTHPLFLVITGIVLLQAALLTGLSLHRRWMHKSKRSADTYDMEENDTNDML